MGFHPVNFFYRPIEVLSLMKKACLKENRMTDDAVNKVGFRKMLRGFYYWFKNGLEVIRTEPQLIPVIVAAFVASRLHTSKSPTILVGTHHKVLTVFMRNVFNGFAKITNRSISFGSGDTLDYSADIILDSHTNFDFSRISSEYVGLHIRRNPRDLVVSASFYHKISDEPWLHIPQDKYGKKTYQQHINAMGSMEEIFLFELDNAAGFEIRQMLNWSYDHGFVELKYEELVDLEGGNIFREKIDHWCLSKLEKSLLECLFNFYSIFGRREKSQHIRDPRSKQFQHHFNEKLYREFDVRFPDALRKLDYTQASE